ncbi:hypothetical protein F0562_027795 [Nyssa sinensis]|uniref:Uncharacterized protein n=1 Tax=Nyssa sinensis TaxID=561372 RepID=A0A5J5B8W3_9ASTE|nr:hypothetical protein F0562_027795 [Nyssa sinensis]
MGKPEGIFSGTDCVSSGFVLDPAKCSRLSLEEKRELVHRIAQWSEDAPKILSSLTREELLEIICAEMGKERKYSGYTKFRMIERLLKLIAGKSNKNYIKESLAFSPTKIESRSKRQRKKECPFQLPTELDYTSLENKEDSRVLLCQNIVCRATLSPEDVFCKRCSCCICHWYDDNKDPTLWLTCESDPPDDGESCGMSCHLQCALEHKRSGILKDGCCTKLDGSFYCVSCGKVNGLMRNWRKQLLVAKEARRVDVLCLRLSLSCKILEGTEQYEELLKIVETAANTIENEVGPLDWAGAKMDRGIVNRLSCGAEVQKLCTSAVEAFDSLFSNSCAGYMKQKEPPRCRICFEESSPTTVIIVLEYEDHLLEEFLGCRLWHRKSTVKDYPEEATFIVLKPKKRFKLTGLSPSTQYFCKVSFFSNTSTLGTWESKWVTPASSETAISILDDGHGEEENDLIVDAHPRMDSMNFSNNKLALDNHSANLRSLDDIRNNNDRSLELPCNNKLASGDHFAKLQSVNDINNKKNDGSFVLHPSLKIIPLVSPNLNSPSTPCKSDGTTRVAGLGGKKQLESDYEYSVRVIRWLEHEGYIDMDFGVKFLNWFSLKATQRERRVVRVFIDTLIDDPPNLAGQLIDTFVDEICSEQRMVSQHRFCTRLWH